MWIRHKVLGSVFQKKQIWPILFSVAVQLMYLSRSGWRENLSLCLKLSVCLNCSSLQKLFLFKNLDIKSFTKEYFILLGYCRSSVLHITLTMSEILLPISMFCLYLCIKLVLCNLIFYKYSLSQLLFPFFFSK